MHGEGTEVAPAQNRDHCNQVLNCACVWPSTLLFDPTILTGLPLSNSWFSGVWDIAFKSLTNCLEAGRNCLQQFLDQWCKNCQLLLTSDYAKSFQSSSSSLLDITVISYDKDKAPSSLYIQWDFFFSLTYVVHQNDAILKLHPSGDLCFRIR